MPVPACSLCPSLSSAPIESVSAALGREQSRLDRNKRFKAKTPKLRIQVAPESIAQSDRNWISWWADETPSLPPTPISPKHPASPSSPLSFFTNRYITSPTTSTFSNIPPMPRGPTTTMASSPARLRGSKSLSVLTDRTPTTSRHSAKQMFAKIKKLASRSTLKEEHLQPREPSPPRRPIPTVSFAPSISSAASFIEFDDAESVVVDNDAASTFVPYLPLVAQYERTQCDRSIRSSATKSTFSRDVYDHSPLSPSPSVNSIRSISTTSTATEPYSPMTPVTPCFAVQQAELGDPWDCPSPGIRASYASSSGIPLSPREVRGRTSSTPAHIPWINRKPSTFLQKHAKPAPTAPLPRVPSVTPTSDTEDVQDSFDEELKDCAGVQQIRARKEAFSGQTRVVRQQVVDRKRGDGEWTLFLGAGVDADAESKESKIMKRHSAGAEKEERWAGEKRKEGRKRVKSESRPASRGVGEDWTLSLPLLMADVPKRKTAVSLTERKPHGEGEASEGSETPTESQPTPKAADKPRLSISRRTSPAPSAGSRRIETIRRPLPFGPSPPASPITPGYASRFPSTISLVSSKRFGGLPPSPITPTARRESKRRSAYSSSGEESLPRPETMESVASVESCSSTATVTLPREKPATPVLEPELMWEEEELECPTTPRMSTIVTSEVKFDFEEEEESDTDSSSVYYSAQSSISICPSR